MGPLENNSFMRWQLFKNGRALAAGLLFLLLAASPAWAGELSPKAAQLQTFLTSLHVDSSWLAYRHVDWYTGVPTKEKIYRHSTHCSAFVASVCCRSGIDLPRPPEYSVILLANAQSDWLSRKGLQHGWSHLSNSGEAQSAANRGELTLAVYRNSDSHKPGHIAIVLPGEKTPQQLAAEGPNVMQAGAENYLSTPLVTGFRHHPDPLTNVAYYSHAWNGN